MNSVASGGGASGHQNANGAFRISYWRVGLGGLQVLVDLDIVGEPKGGVEEHGIID